MAGSHPTLTTGSGEAVAGLPCSARDTWLFRWTVPYRLRSVHAVPMTSLKRITTKETSPGGASSGVRAAIAAA